MGKLEKTKIPFDESDTKLFPKRKKAKSNFENTISKQPLTFSKHKSIVPSKGVKKTKTTKRVLGRKNEMQKTIKAQKYAALVALSAGSIYGISQYTSDMLVLVGGIVLTMFIVEKASK